MNAAQSFSSKRLFALCRKEARQIVRDSSSIVGCFVLPLVVLFIFGFGINFDSTALRVGLALQDQSPEARHLADAFKASPYFSVTVSDNKEDLIKSMQAGRLRAFIVVPVDFSRNLSAGGKTSPIQVITDGSEPSTANFVHAYVNATWQLWLQNKTPDNSIITRPFIDVHPRFWFNQDALSRNVIMPGAVTIFITLIGTILTSLGIAREWERGTMEALLSTRITKAELLLSKLIPYYVLSMLAVIVGVALSIFLFKVPFRGSYMLLWLTSSLYVVNTLGMGLLISTATRNQFSAVQIALDAALMPALILSGLVFEIDSMPAIVRGLSYLAPVRYSMDIMRTLFLAGNVPGIIISNALFLLATASLLLGLTLRKTRMRLE